MTTTTATTTTTHRNFCNAHSTLDDRSDFCAFESEPVEGYTIGIDDDPEQGLGIDLYAHSGVRFSADGARRIAAMLTHAADLVDAAALPGGGVAVEVAHVALLASVDQYAVRDAINSGELRAYKAADGTRRLLIAWDDAMTWARQQGA